VVVVWKCFILTIVEVSHGSHSIYI
jgi:DnaJ homolog subfamily C member 19